MSLSKFITKLSVKGIILVALIFVLNAVVPSIGTIITNHFALGQMENSNEMYILMNAYTEYKPVISGIISAIIIWVVSTIGLDTYKFVKTTNSANDVNGTNEKEN